MVKDFSDQAVVITGAANGIGRLLAGHFDKAGARTFALDLDSTSLERLRADSSPKLQTLLCDLTRPDSVDETFQSILKEVGAVDILINNAGVHSGKWIEDIDMSDVERTFRINSISHFQTVGAVLPGMMKHGRGHIVTIASAGGIVASPRMADYASSKFAALGLDEALRQEFRRRKIPIYTTLVAPFFINTGMFEGVKTRFSWLLPIMDQDQVARRIFHAVCKRKKRLIMPWFVYSAYPLRLLPLGLFDALVSFFGIGNVMDDYTGRSSSSDQIAD